MIRTSVALLMVAAAGSRIAVVVAVEPEVTVAVPANTEPGSPATDSEGRVAAEIARLEGSSESKSAAAVKTLITIGKPAAPDLVKLLGDSHDDVRALAAEALRSILGADPNCAPNWHTQAYWKERLSRLWAGMKPDEAFSLLFPELSPAELGKRCLGAVGSEGVTCTYFRLDDYWITGIEIVDTRHTLERTPRLIRSVRPVRVDPPAGFTGVWTTWYVNGQRAREVHYRNGQYDGAVTGFYDNGVKSGQQQFTMGKCHGPGMGWHRNRKKSFEGQYEHGEQAGTWRYWNEDGRLVSSSEYDATTPVKKTDK